jgi:hypothetical protein
MQMQTAFDEDTIGEAIEAVPVALMPGAVKAFYNDQSKLKSEYKMAYIILQMADLENQYIIEKHKQNEDASAQAPGPTLFVPRTYVDATEPFASISGEKKKIQREKKRKMGLMNRAIMATSIEHVP